MAPSDPMTAPSMDVRLALLEQSVEKMIGLVEGLAADVRKSADLATELAVLRAENTRVTNDLLAAKVEAVKTHDEIGQRIDRLKNDITTVDGKHEATARKIWFWHGAMWDAGAVVGITVGVLAWVGANAINDISALRENVHSIELKLPRGDR